MLTVKSEEGKGAFGALRDQRCKLGVGAMLTAGRLHALVNMVWNWDLPECHICGFPTNRLREPGQARF